MRQPQALQRFLDTTRGRIVALLRCRSLTVEELAGELGLTDNAVRAHLATLERDGLVRSAGVRRSSGRGKPAVLYELPRETDVALSRAYPAVLNGVLAQLAVRMPAGELEEFLRDVGRRLAEPHRPASESGHEDRLRAAVALLDALGGAATLEDTNGTTTIRGCGCPLAAAVAEQPETCRAVETMLSEIIGVPVRQCCRHGERPSCCFEVPPAA